MIITTKNINI